MRVLLVLITLLMVTADAFAGGPRIFMAAAKRAAAPAQVTGVSASNSPAQLTVSWSAVSGATSYNVYYRAGSAPTTGTYDGKITGATSPYSINGPLTQGTTYYVGVTAVNAIGESLLSNTASAVAAAPVTSSPYTSTFYMAASQPGRASPDGMDGWVEGTDPFATVVHDTDGPAANSGYIHISVATDSAENDSSGAISKTVSASGTMRVWAKGETPYLLAQDATVQYGLMTGPAPSTTVWQEYTAQLDGSEGNVTITTPTSGSIGWTDVSMIDLPR